jgi:hypothetical protein
VSRLTARPSVLILLVLAAVAGWVAPGEAGIGLALLSLATIPAIIAVPARGRRWLGGVVAVMAGAAAVLGDLGGDRRAMMSVLLLVIAGALTVVGGASWPGMSRRYDEGRPGSVREGGAGADSLELWRSLDRGEDPTLLRHPIDDAPDGDVQQTPSETGEVD